MVYSDTDSYQGIIQSIDFTLFGDSVNTSPFLIADKTREINNAYDEVVSLILKADNRWEFDDNNKTDLPIATTDLTANQQDYNISGATFLKILKIEIKDANGNWQAVNPISIQDKRGESMTDYRKTAGTPTEYDKIGNSIFLYPKPSYASTGGFKVHYQRNVTHFTTADTTAIPGFAENFHKILVYKAALAYAVANGMNAKINILLPLIEKMESAIIDFYGSRDRDDKVTLRLQKENYGADPDDNIFSGVSFN